MIIKAKVKLYDTEENFLSDFQFLSNAVSGYFMSDENTITVLVNGVEYMCEYNLTLLNNIKQALNENDCSNKLNFN